MHMTPPEPADAMLTNPFEALEPRTLLAGDLAMEAVSASVSFSKPLAQRMISASATVQNIGDQTLRGPASVEFLLSSDSTIDSRDFVFARRPLQSAFRPGGRATASVKVPMPHDLVGLVQPGVTLPAGDYKVLARVVFGGDEETTSNNSGEAPGSVTISYDFGDIGRNGSLHLQMLLSFTSFIKIDLRGGGRGELISSGGSFSLVLTGTTARTRLDIETPNSFIFASLGGITVDGPIGLIIAPRVDINGDISISGAVGRIELRDVSNSAWSIGGGGRTSRIEVRNLVNVSLSSEQPISRLDAALWQTFDGGDDAFVAPRVDRLTIRGGFDPDLSIAGSGTAPVLSSVTIRGAATGRWDILGNVNSISVGSTTTGFGANIAGVIRGFKVTNTMSGTLAARNIDTLFVGGSLSGAVIVAGADLGSDAAVGGTGPAADRFGTGQIDVIRVMGSMTNSLIAAGLDPVDNRFLNGDDRFIDAFSRLGNILIRGQATGSSFAAPKLPARASINGGLVSTSSDSRFVTVFA